MKKLTLLLGFLLATVFAAEAQKEDKAPKSPRVTAESAHISVSYGQPSKRDRVIFGSLVPYDKVWRTGANEATEITFKKDVIFGGQEVKAGTYSLFTIPGKEEWTIILNSERRQWGAYEYDKIKDKNVAEVKVKPLQTQQVQEQLLFTVTDRSVKLSWDLTEVVIPVRIK